MRAFLQCSPFQQGVLRHPLLSPHLLLLVLPSFEFLELTFSKDKVRRKGGCCALQGVGRRCGGQTFSQRSLCLALCLPIALHQYLTPSARDSRSLQSGVLLLVGTPLCSCSQFTSCIFLEQLLLWTLLFNFTYHGPESKMEDVFLCLLFSFLFY